MITKERTRRAFYDFLRAQIATTIFTKKPNESQCIILTQDGDMLKTGIPKEHLNCSRNKTKRRVFAKAYRLLKRRCGYWAVNAYKDN